MQNLFAEVEEELPLTLERETDCRETWPKRWALLKAKVEKIYNTQLESQIAALKAELAQQTNNKQSTPCKCVVKRTEVPGMGIIYAQAECPIHGHLHGAHC